MESTTTAKATAIQPAAPDFVTERNVAAILANERALLESLKLVSEAGCEALASIRALARMALMSMEAIHGLKADEEFVHLLEVIMDISSSNADWIAEIAEKQGLDVVPEGWKRRSAARADSESASPS